MPRIMVTRSRKIVQFAMVWVRIKPWDVFCKIVRTQFARNAQAYSFNAYVPPTNRQVPYWISSPSQKKLLD